MKSKKKPRCHNCKFAGQQFKIEKLTHLHCEHPSISALEIISPYETLQVFNSSCSLHEFKTVKE